MKKKMAGAVTKPYDFVRDTDDFERADGDDNSMDNDTSSSFADIQRRDEKEDTTLIMTKTKEKRTIESEDGVMNFMKKNLGGGGLPSLKVGVQGGDAGLKEELTNENSYLMKIIVEIVTRQISGPINKIKTFIDIQNSKE